MSQIIFGGSKGVLLQNHLASLSEVITEELENNISRKTEDELKKELKQRFYINKLIFDTDNAIIEAQKSNEINKIKTRFCGTEQITIKTYHCKIPFQGNPLFLNFRPIAFHGFDKTGTVIRSDYSDSFFLSFTFQCQENSQEQFKHLKTESLQSIRDNCAEINREIENWNTKRLEELINFIYPKVLDYSIKTREFAIPSY